MHGREAQSLGFHAVKEDLEEGTLGRFEKEREDLFALREFAREREERERAFALLVDDKAKLVLESRDLCR